MKTCWRHLEVGDLLARKDGKEDFVKFALVVDVVHNEYPGSLIVICLAASDETDYEFVEWYPFYDEEFHRNFNLL